MDLDLAPKKWMVGRRSFPFGCWPIFGGENLSLGTEGTSRKHTHRTTRIDIKVPKHQTPRHLGPSVATVKDIYIYIHKIGRNVKKKRGVSSCKSQVVHVFHLP